MSCAKSVPGLTNTLKNTKKVNTPVTFMLLHRIGEKMSSTLSPNGTRCVTRNFLG